MLNFSQIHVLVLFLTFLAALILSGLLYFRRKTPGALILSFTFICIALWLFGASLEASAATKELKILWAKIEYIGLVNVLPLILSFVLIYFNKSSQKEAFTSLKWRILIWIIPIIVLVGAWTNEWHGWLWPSFSEIDPFTNIMVYEHGPLFTLSTAYIYLVLCIILVILFLELFYYRYGSYRTQIILMILSMIFPLIASFMYISGISPIKGMDWVALSMFLSTLLITISVLRYGFIDLVPVARELLIDNINSGILVIDPEKRIIDYNQRFLSLVGFEKEKIFGDDVIKKLTPFGFKMETYFSEHTCYDEITFTSREETVIDVVCTPIIRSSKLFGWLLLFNDITTIRKAEKSVTEINKKLTYQLEETERLKNILEDQAVRDSLTGLYNRRYLEETMEREISRAIRKMHFIALLMLDIDYFKAVNDRYGHDIGDQVLCGMAEVINAKSRKEDVACRFGGEEFLLLIPDITPRAALERAEEIRQAFIQRCFDMSEQIEVTVSIGVSIYPQHADNPKTLFRRADQALYTAKHKGRNRVCLASEEGMDE